MRSLTAGIAVALMMLGFAIPRANAETESGGIRKTCLSVTGEAGQRLEWELAQLSAEDFEPAVRAAVEDSSVDYDTLSDDLKRELLLAWRDNARRLPDLFAAFCALYDQGKLPGLGPDVGHGSVGFAWEFFVGESKHEKTLPQDGARDCELPYQVTVEQEERKMKYIFCESGESFTLTSAHAADPNDADSWRKID